MMKISFDVLSSFMPLNFLFLFHLCLFVMAFPPRFLRMVSSFFEEHQNEMITPKNLHVFLLSRYPTMLHGYGAIPRPFLLFLKSYGLQNHSRPAFLLFLRHRVPTPCQNCN